eukprot:5333463-Lingulodinium_polyedra.AAC.1
MPAGCAGKSFCKTHSRQYCPVRASGQRPFLLRGRSRWTHPNALRIANSIQGKYTSAFDSLP